MVKGVKRGKLNNEGVTLVELIVVMAISSIVLTMIIGFITFGSKWYSNSNREVTLQIDSQVLLNQLEDLVLEANQISVYQLDPMVEAYVIYYKESADLLIHEKEMQNLYYMDRIPQEQIRTREDVLGITYTDTNNLMANHISELLFTKETNAKDSVTISLTLSIENNTRKFVKQVTLRNSLNFSRKG